MFSKFRRCGDQKSDREYKEASKQAKKAVRKARKKYERSLAKKFKSNPKAFYSYISRNTKVKAKVGPLVDGEGNQTNDD